tara:strand:- start:1 stop:222 length:222 start_codon:yes stop_codon:yes gene_type:complete
VGPVVVAVDQDQEDQVREDQEMILPQLQIKEMMVVQEKFQVMEAVEAAVLWLQVQQEVLMDQQVVQVELEQEL